MLGISAEGHWLCANQPVVVNLNQSVLALQHSVSAQKSEEMEV